jgi:hypothetical protein
MQSFWNMFHLFDPFSTSSELAWGMEGESGRGLGAGRRVKGKLASFPLALGDVNPIRQTTVARHLQGGGELRREELGRGIKGGELREGN